jgi:hypothetical protein
MLLASESCSNEAVYVGKSLLRLQEFVTDLTGNKAMDALITMKTAKPDTVKNLSVSSNS